MSRRKFLNYKIHTRIICEIYRWGSKSPSPRNFHVEKSGLQLMIESPTKNQFLNQSDVSLVSLRDILQCEHCPCWCPLIAIEYSSDFLNIDAFEAWYHHHIIVTLLPAQLIEQQVHIRWYFPLFFKASRHFTASASP